MSSKVRELSSVAITLAILKTVTILQDRNRLDDIENKSMATKREREERDKLRVWD